jgi:hypothetical protein
MTLTVALALIITPSVGLLAAQSRDPKAESEQLAREADLSLRADLLGQGFAPFSERGERGERGVLTLHALGIEVLTPERDFQRARKFRDCSSGKRC